MCRTLIQTGQTEQIEVLILDLAGSPLTGLSDILLSIRRISDGYRYDFNDLTFKNAGWTTRQQTMAEISSIYDSGVYYYSFDTSAITNVTANDTYQIRVDCTSASNVPQVAELKVGDYLDNIADIQDIVKNKLTINVTTSELELWNAAGTTILYTWPLTDKDGSVISLTAGPPANRGVPV